MGDIRCGICGEPWDWLEAKDGDSMTAEEYERLMKGNGCPSCDRVADMSIEERMSIQMAHLNSIFNETDEDPIQWV